MFARTAPAAPESSVRADPGTTNVATDRNMTAPVVNHRNACADLLDSQLTSAYVASAPITPSVVFMITSCGPANGWNWGATWSGPRARARRARLAARETRRTGGPAQASRVSASRSRLVGIVAAVDITEHLQFAWRLQPPIAAGSSFVAAASVRGLSGRAQVADRARAVDAVGETVFDPHDHGASGGGVLEQRAGDAL